MNLSRTEALPDKTSRSFRREIIWVLLIKLVLIFAIKSLFFSHPHDKGEVAQRIAQVVGGDSAGPVATSKPNNPME